MTRRFPDISKPRGATSIGAAIGAGLGMLAGIVALIVIGMVVAMLLGARAHATWKPRYADAPQALRDWYRNAELTEQAQRRFNFVKCCDHADVVETRFRVDKSSGRDIWLWLDPADGQWHVVPPDIIHEQQRAPGGKPVLFVYQGVPTCFFLPESGI